MPNSPSWTRIAHECARPEAEGGLSDADGDALEARVLADETDVDARVRLVGFYFLRPAPEHHRRRAEHLTWLATHRPDIGLSGFGYIEEEQAPEGHEATRRAWTAAAAAPDADIVILQNAAEFLGFNRPADAIPLLRRAASLQPDNSRWPMRLAQAHSKQARWAEDDDERRGHAREAMKELDVGLSLARDELDALGLRIDLTQAAMSAEDWPRVRETAARVLADNETCRRSFQYGNAIHRANVALGFAALAENDLATASEHLVRAGKTPGSPQLNSFGPDLELARTLLDRGERSSVVTYLEECARFWKGREALLARWRGAVERGEPTDLEPCCSDDD